jgi:hypothetical protein
MARLPPGRSCEAKRQPVIRPGGSLAIPNKERKMAVERPLDRMPLRNILAQASKITHEIADLCNKNMPPRLADLHELSRANRKKSHYPTIVAVENGVHHYRETSTEILNLVKSLEEHLDAIRQQSNRARMERGG